MTRCEDTLASFSRTIAGAVTGSSSPLTSRLPWPTLASAVRASSGPRGPFEQAIHPALEPLGASGPNGPDSHDLRNCPAPRALAMVLARPMHAAVGMEMRILVGVDGSEAATIACHFVASRAWPVGAAVELIAAYELPIDLTGLAPSAVQSTGHEIEALAIMLEDLAAPVRAAGLRVQRSVVEGRPADVLIRRASEAFADLIVIGTEASVRLRPPSSDRSLRTSSTMPRAQSSWRARRGPAACSSRPTGPQAHVTSRRSSPPGGMPFAGCRRSGERRA